MNKQNLEYRITDLVSLWLPWIVPITTAFLIGRASFEHLGFPLPVAIAAALAIEGMGFVTTNTALMLRQYNQAKRKSDPLAPFWISTLLVAGYLLVAVMLTLALDVLPTIRAYAGSIFPFLSLTAMISAALRHDHKRRLLDIDRQKAERRTLRKQRKADVTPDTQTVTPDTRRVTLLQSLKDNPEYTPTMAAQEFNVSRATIYNDLEKLEKAGEIRRNGDGVEVV